MPSTKFPLLRLGKKDAGAKGPVHTAQWLLHGHNVFNRDFDPGPINGEFGEQTAEAAKRAKHALGYLQAEVLPTFGPQLRAYLTGEEPLPPDYKTRAASRAKAETPKYLYPAAAKAKLIGFPGQGTHSFKDPPSNWQSDDAWDIAFPYGTPLVAIADGKIGPRIGPLDSSNPRFAGLRCTLVAADNEFYYAHCSRFAPGIEAGVRVEKGQVIAYSGRANGVEHLHLGVKDWRAYERVVEQ